MKNKGAASKRFYKVAGHAFSIMAEEEDFLLMDNYAPFRSEAEEQAFYLIIEEGKSVCYSEDLRQEEEGREVVCGRTTDGRFVFEFTWGRQTAGWLVCSTNFLEGQLIVTGFSKKNGNR